MAHQARVFSLYRRALKLTLDWSVHRHIWRGQAMYIRSLFEAQKNVREPRQQKALIEETEALLEKWKHPDPYRPPTAPGGSKYERNLPAPILDRGKDQHIITKANKKRPNEDLIPQARIMWVKRLHLNVAKRTNSHEATKALPNNRKLVGDPNYPAVFDLPMLTF
ncbi:hypothetical protein EG327_008077 [Venturia inaequalis]|uniref:NADH dehydrogenase [ubiquinone] 1 beta subcomplex subunit 9 n=1 Tax=Venturia inaequalis TaxID=5025 RepID=A0A8H3VXF8_VENIN|nr:hypothetical protein EG327_008077 [Venturia inaequalis]